MHEFEYPTQHSNKKTKKRKQKRACSEGHFEYTFSLTVSSFQDRQWLLYIFCETSTFKESKVGPKLMRNKIRLVYFLSTKIMFSILKRKSNGQNVR